jgi:hypothetical protein
LRHGPAFAHFALFGLGLAAGAPMAIAPLIIRWGPDTSSDMLRRCARCTVCGHKGATLQGPGWKNGEVEWEPFPVEEVDR